MPCGKYLVAMLGLWLPSLAEAGDLGKPFAIDHAIAELKTMSTATVDRYLKPAPGPDADHRDFDDDAFAVAAELDHHPPPRR